MKTNFHYILLKLKTQDKTNYLAIYGNLLSIEMMNDMDKSMQNSKIFLFKKRIKILKYNIYHTDMLDINYDNVYYHESYCSKRMTYFTRHTLQFIRFQSSISNHP